jgi:hypothetical protein
MVDINVTIHMVTPNGVTPVHPKCVVNSRVIGPWLVHVWLMELPSIHKRIKKINRVGVHQVQRQSLCRAVIKKMIGRIRLGVILWVEKHNSKQQLEIVQTV